MCGTEDFRLCCYLPPTRQQTDHFDEMAKIFRFYGINTAVLEIVIALKCATADQLSVEHEARLLNASEAVHGCHSVQRCDEPVLYTREVTAGFFNMIQ